MRKAPLYLWPVPGGITAKQVITMQNSLWATQIVCAAGVQAFLRENGGYHAYGNN